MKDLPIFNKGDKVTVNNKYIGLESMVGEIYTIRAGPARCSDTWCYWLENVAGGIAADALEPLEQTNEEYIRSCSTEELAKLIYKIAVTDVLMDRFFTAEVVNAGIVDVDSGVKEAENWLKEKHHE